jgi:hypothetical protein
MQSIFRRQSTYAYERLYMRRDFYRSNLKLVFKKSPLYQIMLSIDETQIEEDFTNGIE